MDAQKSNATMLQQLTDLLKNTTEMSLYLDLLKIVSSEYLIVFSIKDTAGSKMQSPIIQKIHELGMATFDTKLWVMHAGIVYKSVVVFDKSGETPEEPVYHECDVDGCSINIVSESYRKKNQAAIVINGVDYSLNNRGVNIVVYNMENHTLIDSISFDSHDNPAGVFTRRDRKMVVCSKVDIESVIMQINKRLDRLEEIKNNMLIYDTQNKFMLWQAMAEKGEQIFDAKKRFFMSMEKASGSLRQMQLAGAILLAKFAEVCRANGLTYWISYGTLLGAVRHKGFIPWDDDTDVCMMRSEVDKLTKIMEKDEDFYVYHLYAANETDMNHCVRFKYRADNTPYFLDIFIYDYCDDISPENVSRQEALNNEMARVSQSIRTAKISAEEKDKQYRELFDRYLAKSRETVGTTDVPSKYMIWAIDNYRCSTDFQRNCVVTSIFPLKQLVFEGIKVLAPCDYEGYLSDIYGDIYSMPNNMFSHRHVFLNPEQERVIADILAKYSHLLRK